jgi:DDE superfamily endonuclease/Helix-turn-helix of DDE superfamily endonuclease
MDVKLLFILFYFKCYPTFDLLGILFDVDRSQANRWVHRLQPILETALGKKLALPERKLTSVQHFLERFPSVQFVMIDGTERPIARPQDLEQQSLNYSGKKKRHTRKHLVAVDENKRVLVLSQAGAGKLHDKRLLDEAKIVAAIPNAIPIKVDSGFQGLQNEYVNIEVPHKKPIGEELSQSKKQDNQIFSRERVRCENALAGVKRYRAVADIYRNRVSDFDDRLMLTAVGLWNFYLIAA